MLIKMEKVEENKINTIQSRCHDGWALWSARVDYEYVGRWKIGNVNHLTLVRYNIYDMLENKMNIFSLDPNFS